MTDRAGRASGERVAGGDNRPAPPLRPASPTRPIRPTGPTRTTGRTRPTRPDQDPARIAAMFDRIAARYDLLNRLLSAGLDRRWRARAIAALELTGRETVLDLCTGTADLALAAVRNRKRRAARVVGVDFASRMLHRGQAKLRQARVTEVRLIRGDALRIPLAAGSVDAVTIAFGIRNVSDPAAVCAEMSRVLRPGGQIAILEFGIPQLPGLRVLYLWYFRRVLPRNRATGLAASGGLRLPPGVCQYVLLARGLLGPSSPSRLFRLAPRSLGLRNRLPVRRREKLTDTVDPLLATKPLDAPYGLTLARTLVIPGSGRH